ncbi:MAG: MCP four helix bundle domain-containing protein [Planctomycetes bacterium]|nr:MCP four helix bundle domain-containing protein [Planctomycetota bacterium]
MTWFKNLKTSVKLFSAFAVMAALVGIVGWFGIRSLASVNENLENVYEVQLLPCLDLTTMRGNMHKQRGNVWRALSEKDKKEIETTLEENQKLVREMTQLKDRFEPTIHAESVRVAFNRFKDAEREYYQLREDKVLKPFLAGDLQQAFKAANEMGALYKNAINAINATIDAKTEIAKSKFEHSQEVYASTRTTALASVAIGILFAIGIGWVIARLITKPLVQSIAVCDAVKARDFSKRVDLDTRDELGQMAQALNDMVGQLKIADEAQKKQLEQATAMARQGAMLESMTASITYADREGKITYINPAAMQMFRKIEKHLPVRVEQLLGQSIDVFHKNPAHQRRIISDPNNLPYRGQVAVGGETFDLVVSAIFDQNKQYIGNLVSWEVVTEKLAKDRQILENGEREKKAADELRAKVDSILGNVNGAATGDLTQVVQISGEDAIGQMGEAFGTLLGNLRGSIGSISHNATALASSSEELSSVSTQMSANAEETSAQSGVVSAAAEQVSKNVQTVATAVEEMSASIKEIAKNAGEGAKIASNAVQDQPLGLKRHYRGGTGRRGGQGICRGRQRSQGIGQGDREGHGGHQPEDRGHPGRYQGRRRRDQADQRHHHPDERHLQQHRRGR